MRWDKRTSLVEHVTCPPVVQVAAEAYREPPVTADLWKRYCASIVELMADAEQMKKEKQLEKHKARCGTCGLEWTGYAKLAGTKHLAMANRCGGEWLAV